MNEDNTTRRDFMRAVGGVLGASCLGSQWPLLAQAAEHAHAAAAGTITHEFRVLDEAQARDVAALAARIVPSGDTPGASEAGVVYFIDHVHAGPYARSAPEFLAGLEAFRAEFATLHAGQGQFADLAPDAQHAYLKRVETTPFFGRMKWLTVIGLLALPAYGGNEHKLGWQLVGFVDQHAWTPPFGYYDRDYPGFQSYDAESRS